MGKRRWGFRPTQALEHRTLAIFDQFGHPDNLRLACLPKGQRFPGRDRIAIIGAGEVLGKMRSAWSSMHHRCADRSNPAFRHYGGRGISVCPRWADFCAFLSDMGYPPTSRHSIERINNDGNYEPGNCRWATIGEQQANRRNSLHVVYQGRRMPVGEFADRIGFPRKDVSVLAYAGLTPGAIVEFLRQQNVSFCA